MTEPSADLAHLVHDALDDLRPELPPGLALRLSVDWAAMPVAGDPVELHRRIAEDLRNTLGALEGQNDGTAVVRLEARGPNARLTLLLGDGRPLLDRTYALTRAATTHDDRMPGGSETVLFAEDEMVLRETGRRLLERLGYRVLTVSTGDEAWSILSAPDCTVDLLITDVSMPGMNGLELVRRLREMMHPVRILVASGTSPLHDKKAQSELLNVAFVVKPFMLEDLATAVRLALDDELPG
jgi:CheY-like chemotaxis protein